MSLTRPSGRNPLPDLSADAPRRLLLAASTGGHISQLVRLADGQLGARDDSLWITFDSPQTRSLLKGRDVMYVPYIRPRDWRSTLRAFRMIHRAVERESFEAAVSTGAALAVAALGVARVKSIPCLYIESISRVQGPSLSGRVLHASRAVQMRAQHSGWVHGRWGVNPSVLSTFSPVDRPPRSTRPRVFVTLGTIQGYRFDSLVDAVLATGLVGDDTTWQLGCTDRTDELPGRVVSQLDGDDFARTAREADVVITHSGVGTIMQLLEMGIYPVTAVRRSARHEHVDDHQEQIAGLLAQTGVGLPVEVEELSAEVILAATRRAIVQDEPVGAVAAS